MVTSMCSWSPLASFHTAFATKGYRIDCPSEGGAAMTTGLQLALAGGALVGLGVGACLNSRMGMLQTG
jgi:hypothetical protein